LCSLKIFEPSELVFSSVYPTLPTREAALNTKEGALNSSFQAFPSGSTTVSSTACSDAEAALPLQQQVLRRVPLAQLRGVWRPEERVFFIEAHPWYAAMSQEDRGRLFCLEYEPGCHPRTTAAPESVPSFTDNEMSYFFTRDRAIRDRFVACIKVLRLSVP